VTAYGGGVTADDELVPVWTLATDDVSVPDVMGAEGMTPARLDELRTILATLADAPIATLEAHQIFERRDQKHAVVLHAGSPLAQQLSQLVANTAKSGSSAVNPAATGDILYRMVVPAKVAAQFGKGLVKPMVSKAVDGGIYDNLVNVAGKSIAAKASFVPVAGSAAAAGAAAGTAVTAGAVVTVAAPLVLLAVAVGVTAYAEHQRQQAIERITDLLEQLHEDKLDDERSELDGCRDAIDKATSIVLDKGRIGMSLGLDSAVHAIGKSIERSSRRLIKWQSTLDGLPDGAVELTALADGFPGIDAAGGAFRAHLELARLAIALKRRVLVLQAVEHAQLEGATHPFTTFVRTLQEDERRVDELETGITSVLLRLSNLELKHRSGIRSIMFTAKEVDHLLEAAYRLRAMGDGVSNDARRSDVAIEIERNRDGSLVVHPAVAV
jgi:hypothetical protein